MRVGSQHSAAFALQPFRETVLHVFTQRAVPSGRACSRLLVTSRAASSAHAQPSVPLQRRPWKRLCLRQQAFPRSASARGSVPAHGGECLGAARRPPCMCRHAAGVCARGKRRLGRLSSLLGGAGDPSSPLRAHPE